MWAFLILALVVFLASIVGLASRHAFSVSFWPANGVLVGLALRDRRLFRVSGWLGAGIGFVAADVLFGNRLSLALFFAFCNLVGTAVATVLLRQLSPRDLGLRRVHSVLRILSRLLPASIAAGLCGALLVHVEFHGSALQALMTWPASELVNYLIVLPAMLVVQPPWRRPALESARAEGCKLAPALFLALSCVAMVAFDGPGSIVFPLPALLLCALTYSVSATSLMTMALGTWCMTMIGLGHIDIGQDLSVPHMVVSIRVAVAFLVLVPLTISSAMAVRDDLLAQLRQAADHDGLTGLLNRRAFEQRMSERLDTARSQVVLWLDIDHFKSVNDRYGHMAGDAVLKHFAKIARSCCRATDLVGRMGGEEFALVIDVASATAGEAVAERLRRAFAERALIWNDVPIRASVSIGAVHLDHAVSDVPELVSRLDDALYRAKRKGRDRVEWLAGQAAEMPLSACA
jgi:diguanylate cyclase (GGDEF)-like protein